MVFHRPPVRITHTVNGITKKQTPKNSPLRIIMTTTFRKFLAQYQQYVYL